MLENTGFIDIWRIDIHNTGRVEGTGVVYGDEAVVKKGTDEVSIGVPSTAPVFKEARVWQERT